MSAPVLSVAVWPDGPLPALFVSGPGALCRGPARGPALFVSGPGAGTGTLCVGPRRFLSGPDALSLGLGRSLSGCVWSPDCFCIGARRSSAVSLCWGPALCVGARRSFFVSRPGALCVGPGAPSESRGPALFVSLCVGGPARLLSGGARRFLRLEGAAGLCVGPPCVLSRSVSGPGGPLPALFGTGPGALCRGPALFGTGALCFCLGPRRSFYRARAICVRVCLEPGLFLYRSSALFGAPCVGSAGPQRRPRAIHPTLPHPAPGLSRSACHPSTTGPQLRSAPIRHRGPPNPIRTACTFALIRGPPAPIRVPLMRSACHPSIRTAPIPIQPRDPQSTCHLLVGPQLRSAADRQLRSTCHSSDPRATHPALRATHPMQGSDPRATHPAPPARATHPALRAPSSDPRATHPARRVPFFQEMLKILKFYDLWPSGLHSLRNSSMFRSF